jgi:queuine tRNA-ribosyltransferase
MEKEMFGLRLLTIHNIHFLINLVSIARGKIKEGTFTEFKKEFINKFK